MPEAETYYATGKRKTSIARTWLMPGKGEITVNGRSLDNYFKVGTSKIILMQPLSLTDKQDAYDIKVRVVGGGTTGQAGAIRHEPLHLVARLGRLWRHRQQRDRIHGSQLDRRIAPGQDADSTAVLRRVNFWRW